MQEKFQLFGSGETPRKARPPTKEEMTILGDLVTKAVNDSMKALSTTIDLASDTAGLAGVFLIVQKVAAGYLQGSAMTLGAIRKVMSGKMPPRDTKVDEDDMLFVCLLAFSAESGHQESLEKANNLFQIIRGRRYDLPSDWSGRKL